MKKTLKTVLAIYALSLCIAASAQESEYKFTTVVENPITSIKNQNRSGTCWCFSGISFLESEAIRINKIKDEADYPDFSEMFVVSKSYQDRADKYVRLDGNLTFGAGSESEDVLHILKDYGLVPQTVMNGLNYGTDLPVHGEIDALLASYVKVIVSNPNKNLSTAWKNGYKGVCDAYFGACPEEFEYGGKNYTPRSFADSYKLNPDDYVTLTSFTHHPFHTRFALEVCDNWRNDQAYNLPLDEFMSVMFSAIENGYTTTWAGDVSELGFTRKGIAVIPEAEAPKATSGSDQEKWVGKAEEKEKDAKGIPAEKYISQEYRQEGFDNKASTDDHGMHAFGIAKDQNGTRYLMVKNSWGKTGDYDGIWYISESFTRAKALSFIVHKDALPKDIKNKLGIR